MSYRVLNLRGKRLNEGFDYKAEFEKTGNRKYVLDMNETTAIFYSHRLYRIIYRDGSKGGWLESYDNLSQEGYCKVLDNAAVFDNAKVYGNAKVSDNAVVGDNAEVHGDAKVYDNARVSGNAIVHDNAVVYSKAKIYDNAKVYGNANKLSIFSALNPLVLPKYLKILLS